MDLSRDTSSRGPALPRGISTLKAGEKALLPATLEACSGLKASGNIQTLRSNGRTSGSLEREKFLSALDADSRDGERYCVVEVGLTGSPASFKASVAPLAAFEGEALKPSARAGAGGAGLLAAYTTVSQFKHLAQAMLVFSARLTVSREVSEGNWI